MTLPVSSTRAIVVLLAMVTVGQCYYNTTLPLSGDEAYYWVWSKTLQMGYHDHPPAIALLIALTTRLYGDGLLGVRLAAALSMAGTVFLLSRVARSLSGEAAALLTVILALALPAVEMGFTLATPDGPLALFWSAGLWFGMDALTGPGRWRDYLAAGACCGLAMASKYTGLLLPLSFAAYLLVYRRDLLVSPRPWAAVAVAAAVFSPVLWWNATHGFESFLFQYRHGSGDAAAFHWKNLAQFLGGQALAVSPVIFGLMLAQAAGWRRWRHDPPRALLAVCFLLPMAVFLEKALFAKIQINWALPAYLAALPWLADGLLRLRRRWRPALTPWLMAATLLPAVLLSVAIKWPLLLGLSGRLNPQNRLFGPDVAAVEVERQRRPGDAIFADHLQRASLLRFHLAGQPRVYIPTQTRYSEYTRWDRDVAFAGMHGLYLSQDDRLEELRRIFGNATLIERIHARRPGVRDEFYFLYRVGEQAGD